MILRIAFKNVWRNKVRSLIVIISVTLGLAGGVFAVAIITGMVEQKIRADINNEVSHIQIHDPHFLENFETGDSIPAADSITSAISRMSGVKAVCSRIRLTGMAASPNGVAGVQIKGIDPLKEKRVTRIFSTIPDTCGNYFEATRKNQVLIGRALADKLKVRLKSKIVLRFQDIDGNLTEAAFSVTGIYQTANTVFDETTIFVKKTDLKRILGAGSGQHEIAILLDDIDKIPGVEGQLKKTFTHLEIMSWMELRPEMGVITSAIAIEAYIILAIILFALAFGIVNTMLMVVFERTRELGMLMAVGMSKARVFRMIMMETIFLTVIGGIIGMALSAFLVSYFQHVGIDLSSVSKGLGAYGFDPHIYPFIRTSIYFHLSIMVVCTAVLAAIMPARKALQLKPVEAIRVE
jgi:putative ABC transport system permease protein